MSANSRCSFCLELPAMPHAKAGSANLNRCPVCKGELIRVHGVTYRAEDSAPRRSRLGPIAAVLALIAVAGGVAALAWPRVQEPVPVAIVTKPVSAPVIPLTKPEPATPTPAPQAQPAPQPRRETRTVIHVDVVAGAKRNTPARIKSQETATPTQPAPSESAAVAEATPASPAPTATGPSRWARPWTEHELRQMLYDVPEVAMDTRLLGRHEAVAKGWSKGISNPPIQHRATTSRPPDIEAVWKKLREQSSEQKDKLIEQLIKEQPALAQLPMLKGDACKLSKEQAEILDQYSQSIRRGLARRRDLSPDRPIGDLSKAADAFDQIYGGQVPAERAKSIGYLLQGFQTAYLNHANYSRTQPTSPPSTMDAAKRLVKRALFDPAKEVRLAAIDRLKDYRDVGATPLLMEGLNHSWPPINYNAAEALVALRPANIVPALQKMLHAPNPAAPFEKIVEGKRTLVVPEMVRINHHGNCLLCHAPSTSDKDLVRGLVPHPSERMREVYYQSRESDAVFVRADITYLRQEFSEILNVDDHGEWPSEQRFDFLVRLRPLTDAEATEWKARKHRAEATPPPPARRAVMFAIERLTQ